MRKQLVFFGDAWLDRDNEKHLKRISDIDRDDLAKWRARSVVEVLDCRIANNKFVAFHWEDHYDRLIEACKGRFNLAKLPTNANFLHELFKMAQGRDIVSAVIHILVSPGPSDDLKTALGEPVTTLDVRSYEFANAVRPLKLMTIPAQRLFPEAKLGASYGYVEDLMNRYEVREKGFDSFIYCSESLMFPRKLLECPYENIFVANQSQLLTPSLGVLHGVTRRIILEQARKAKLFTELSECKVFYESVYRGWYKEAFRTSTTQGVVPIEQIDGHIFKVGEDTFTEKLRLLFLEYRENYYKERGA